MSTDFRTTNLELIAHAYASQVRCLLQTSKHPAFAALSPEAKRQIDRNAVSELLDSLTSENGVQDDGATIWFCSQDGFSEITVWGGNEYDPDMGKMVTVKLW